MRRDIFLLGALGVEYLKHEGVKKQDECAPALGWTP